MKKVLLVASLMGAALSANAALVINEIQYDPNGTDTNIEYLELYNNSATPIDASAFTVQLYNGVAATAVVYATVTLPGVAASNTTVIPGFGFYVIGAGTFTPKNQAFAGATDQLQNGSGDGVVLRDAAAVKLDSILYEYGGSVTVTGPPDVLENGGYRASQASTTAVAPQISGKQNSIGRFPDGVDTNDNNADFYVMPPSPQLPNEGTITLPYTNTFDTVGPLAQTNSVYNTFVGGSGIAAGADIAALPATSVVALDLATVPVSPDPVSPGSALRVRDISGGGDEWVFGGPGNSGNINIQGFWFLKATTSFASENSGITLKNTKSVGFFGNNRTTAPFGYESGVSLSYTGDGSAATTLQGIPATELALKVDAHVSSPESDTNLANVAKAGNVWVPFRMFLDYSGPTRFYVSVDNVVIYDNVIPAGTPTIGGATLGYRQSTGTFGDTAGAWFDAVTVNTDVTVVASVGDWTVINE